MSSTPSSVDKIHVGMLRHLTSALCRNEGDQNAKAFGSVQKKSLLGLMPSPGLAGPCSAFSSLGVPLGGSFVACRDCNSASVSRLDKA